MVTNHVLHNTFTDDLDKGLPTAMEKVEKETEI